MFAFVFGSLLSLIYIVAFTYVQAQHGANETHIVLLLFVPFVHCVAYVVLTIGRLQKRGDLSIGRKND